METNKIYKKGIDDFEKYFKLNKGMSQEIQFSIKTLTLDILKADIERLKNTMLGGTIINRDTGVYNNVLQDQIDYYQKQIKLIEEI